jgi:hypothetical protein
VGALVALVRDFKLALPVFFLSGSVFGLFGAWLSHRNFARGSFAKWFLGWLLMACGFACALACGVLCIADAAAAALRTLH